MSSLFVPPEREKCTAFLPHQRWCCHRYKEVSSMDKFKKEAIRGIQRHNSGNGRSHSNPDIDYDRSLANYELHEPALIN
ncbi:plasmid recombination protein [Desulfovibrio piger]|uniref:plasmid recombination protein n=1 Tax=Desulfovibrio piger TaxID=901 RepID=UPI0034C6D438